MCGFMGAVGVGVDVERGLPWLARRGPDSHRMWSSADGCVTLLHCRLAIVDTDPRADQPFRDKNREITVALNGEIYNYRQLRRELANYPFRSESDTEVIVAAYLAHGVDGFRRLSGMFAFVLVDEAQRRILLVRDAVGKKPLFMRRAGDCILFGSSVLPLVACGGRVGIDHRAARFYWTRGYISPDASAIDGVRPILPGEVVELDWQGGEAARRYCEPPPSLLYQGEGAADVDRNIRTLIAQAVTRRLENNPDPDTLLSGGIDSTVVTEVAQTQVKQAGRSKSLKVLTLGALIPYSQDEFFARYAARRLRLPLQIVSPCKGRLFDSIARALSVQDEPLGMPSYFLLHQMVEAAAQHGRVLLTGDGGDEVFLGYRPPTDWKSHNLPASDEPPFVKVGPGPAEWMATWARDVTGSTLLGHMFAKSDRASAEQGVEMRCPLLDWSLFCYVRSLPYEIVEGNGHLKPLLKRQLARWPRWFLERRKLGFAFNLRWRWGLSRFDGLRETVKDEAVETFGDLVPRELHRPARHWTTKDIMNYFGEAWRLLVWSAFLNRLSEAARGGGSVGSEALPIAVEPLLRIGKSGS
jgi:asparagine synthase (glutamine-hydrolysing)